LYVRQHRTLHPICPHPLTACCSNCKERKVKWYEPFGLFNFLRLGLTIHAVRKRSRAAAIASGGAKSVPTSQSKRASPSTTLGTERASQRSLPLSVAIAHAMPVMCTRRMITLALGAVAPTRKPLPRQIFTAPTISNGTTPSSSTMAPNSLARISHVTTSHATRPTPPVGHGKNCRGRYYRHLRAAPQTLETRAPSIRPIAPVPPTRKTAHLRH